MWNSPKIKCLLGFNLNFMESLFFTSPQPLSWKRRGAANQDGFMLCWRLIYLNSNIQNLEIMKQRESFIPESFQKKFHLLRNNFYSKFVTCLTNKILCYGKVKG